MFNFGFGGGMGGGAPRRPPVDNSKLYKLLEVEKTASEAEIKKAYRRQAMIHHPDKGGDEQKFHEIQGAYEILSNPEKRQLYDEGGEEAVEQGGMGGGDMGDIFEMFGGGGGRRRPQQRRRGEDVLFPLPVTLEELYNGAVKKLRLTRNVICKPCEGKGGKTVNDCSGCQGRGVKVQIRQVGPGMISQSQVTCPTCNGAGKVIPQGSKCTGCTGAGTVKEKQQIEVNIPRGSHDQSDIIFKGHADEAPGSDPGDVIVRLQMKPNDLFKREGNHLIQEISISLYEALTGFSIFIKTLDNRILQYVHKTVVTPGTFLKIEDEGMPIPKNGGIQSGNLYLKVSIDFPTKVVDKEDERQALSKIIGKQTKRVDPKLGDVTPEDVMGNVCDFKKEEEKFKKEEQLRAREQANSKKSQYDDDDDHSHGSGGGGPACQQV